MDLEHLQGKIKDPQMKDTFLTRSSLRYEDKDNNTSLCMTNIPPCANNSDDMDEGKALAARRRLQNKTTPNERPIEGPVLP